MQEGSGIRQGMADKRTNQYELITVVFKNKNKIFLTSISSTAHPKFCNYDHLGSAIVSSLHMFLSLLSSTSSSFDIFLN